MDVVINKRKIRDTVKQLVDHGQKNQKQENRSHPANPVFQVPCLIGNGFGGNPYLTAGTLMAVKQF